MWNRLLDVTSTVALLLLTVHSTARPQAVGDIQPGARIRVQQRDGDRQRTVTGILIVRSGDSLQLKPEGSRDTVAIPLARVSLLQVSRERRSAAGTGAAIGLVSGALLGLVAGSSCDCGKPGLAGLVIGGMLGGLGSGVGAAVGSMSSADHWQPVTLTTEPRASAASAGVPLLLVRFTFRGPT